MGDTVNREIGTPDFEGTKEPADELF